MESDAVERIGHLPAGKGLLGALIDDPHTIRLRNIGDDPRSVGFPPKHPPMASYAREDPSVHRSAAERSLRRCGLRVLSAPVFATS
jgi:hypothetical protein